MTDVCREHALTLISTLHTQPHEGALIEITGLMPRSRPVKHYFTRPDLAAGDALSMNNNGYSAFVSVNPRKAFSGFETDVTYAHALPLDLQPERTSIRDVYNILTHWGLPPSIVAVSGFGYHFYLLVEPVDPIRAKTTSERLCKWTLSDPIFSTNRIMRCTGTWNYKKNPAAPCYLTEVQPQRRYTIDFVEARMDLAGAPPARQPHEGIPVPIDPPGDLLEMFNRIRDQPGGEGIVDIINTGERNAYSEKQISRSEADWAVVCALVRAGASDEFVHWVYERTPVGDMKYKSSGVRYLNKTIEAARRATSEKRQMQRGARSRDQHGRETGASRRKFTDT